MPIDLIIHTPGGIVLAAMQIARAVEAHKAKVTVYVPVYVMSGGTLIALAADEIVLGEFSVLGPIDQQIAGLPAASIVKVRDSKPVEAVFDLTLVLADVGMRQRLACRSVSRHRAHRDSLNGRCCPRRWRRLGAPPQPHRNDCRRHNASFSLLRAGKLMLGLVARVTRTEGTVFSA
jgi:hypothetical protein